MENTQINSEELRKDKDLVIFLNEFVVTYEKPLECDPHRGYFAIYVTYEHTYNDNPVYEKEYVMSGDNDMIIGILVNVVSQGSDYIETYLE